MTQHVSRRDFFKMSGGLAAGAGVASTGLASSSAQAAPLNTSTILPYPAIVIGKLGGMKVNEPVAFTYPDVSSPCQAIRMGEAVPRRGGTKQRHRRLQHPLHASGLSDVL